MEHGDISNEVVPRLALVFENLIGILPTKPEQARFALYRRLRQPKRATKVFQANQPVCSRIWDVTWRLKFAVESVTFLGPEYVDPIIKWLEAENLPIGHVWSTTPSLLSREIAYMPYLAAIFDPDPEHQFTYGSRGRHINPSSPDIIGRL